MTATTTKTSHKKGSRATSKFLALIPSRSIRQMLTICSGVEFDEVRGKKKENRCHVFASSSKRESSLTDRRVPSKDPISLRAS